MAESLKICIVSTFYPPYNFGGDGIYAHRLANGLADRGHRVTVLHCPDAYELLAGTRLRSSYDDRTGVEVVPIRTPLPRLALLAVHQTGRPCLQARQLNRHLNRRTFDVIHYNNCSLLGGPTAFTYGRALKLCTLIEHWLVCPLHVLWKYDRRVCEKPTCIRCTLHGKRPVQWWRHTGLLRRCARHIDAFIAPSEFTRSEHQRRGLSGRFVQLPLFHSEPPTASEFGIPRLTSVPDRPYFLFVGRLEKIKGLQNLIPVFRQRTNANLVVVGTGSYEPVLRKMAAGMANVQFLGRKEHPQLSQLYRRALAVIVPSICYETFGIVVVEAFATGTPVVVNDLGALPELVRRHGGGFVYRNSEELMHVLDQLSTDLELRNRLGDQGRTAYLNEYAAQPFIDRYLDIVSELRRETGPKKN